MDLARDCDGLFTLPVREKALSWTGDGLFPLPVEEKAIMGLGVRLRLPFPPACRGKGCFMDLARVCDGLFPLPVEEKAVSWTWCVLAIGFSPCLSRKRLSHGLGVRLRWPFPPACRGKDRLMDLVCDCDGLFPSACRGKGCIMDLV